jgi:uncharacterized protein YaaN involved in tellurite resistance
MEQDAEQVPGNAGKEKSEVRETDIIQAGEPRPPDGMSNDEAQKTRNEAAALIQHLSAVSGSKELEILDKMSNMGIQTQRNAAGYLDLLKGRVSTFLNDGGPSRQIADSMRELRISLDQINPNAKPRTIWDQVYNLFPFFGMRNPVRILQKIALRYEPLSRQITIIESRLRDGRTMLARDNIELRKLYEQVENQRPVIQRNAYFGELLMMHLTQVLQNTPDAMKREKIRAVLHDVAMRVQDLRTMEEVHVQYFVSIEISRQNNNRLGQAVDRTLTLSTNVTTIGLAIQSALIRQKSVMEATRRTREFLGTLIAANAASIKTHTREIGDLYINPVIAMDKITQAHDNLIEALDIADRLRQEGINVARDNIVKLTELSATLMMRAGGLLESANQNDELKPIGSPENPRLEIGEK